MRGRAEEAVRGRQTLDRLVRALEVVVLDEQSRATLAVIEVGEHRAREELLPHRLPEPLDLAAGLRVVRPALHVANALAPKLLLEPRLATPGGVLAPLIGEDLARRAMVGNPARQRLEHERAPLVVRHHQAHDIARMIIQERRDINPLVAPKEEGEEVRLPQLIGLRALEAPRRHLGSWLHRRTLLGKPLLFKYPAHRRLGGADAEEAPHHIANPAAARLRFCLLRLNHRLAARIALRACLAVTHRGARFLREGRTRTPLWITARLAPTAPRRLLQRRSPPCPVFLRPLTNRGVRNPQLTRHPMCRDPFVHHHRSSRHHHVLRPRRARLPAFSVLRFRVHSFAPFGLPRQPKSEASARWFLAHASAHLVVRGANLFYNYFRDYDSGIGRYIESDPIGLAGGFNTYAYVDLDPLRFFDDQGLVKGERGRTRSPGGTDDPSKHWKDDPKNPGWGWQKDQNGKKVYKRRPPYITPRSIKRFGPLIIWGIMEEFCNEFPEDPACAIFNPGNIDDGYACKPANPSGS